VHAAERQLEFRHSWPLHERPPYPILELFTVIWVAPINSSNHHRAMCAGSQPGRTGGAIISGEVVSCSPTCSTRSIAGTAGRSRGRLHDGRRSQTSEGEGTSWRTLTTLSRGGTLFSCISNDRACRSTSHQFTS